MILILALFSCKPGKNKGAGTDKKNVLLYYAKGPCLGRCPVYHLWVFTDGTILYKGVDKGDQKKEIKSRLSSNAIADLVMLLDSDLVRPMRLNRIRDIPVTTLKFDGKEYEYHASQVKGQLKKVNLKIEGWVTQLSLDLPINSEREK